MFIQGISEMGLQHLSFLYSEHMYIIILIIIDNKSAYFYPH